MDIKKVYEYIFKKLPAFFAAGHSFSKILRNSGWLMGDRVARMGVGLLISAATARHLGPESFGELSYVLTFVVFFQVFSCLGLDKIAIQKLSQSPETAGVILGTVFRMRLISAVITLVCASISITLLRPNDYETLVLVVVVASGVLFQATDVIDYLFQSQTRSRYSIMPKAIAFAIASFARIAMILLNAQIWAFCVIQVLEMAISSILLVLTYRQVKQVCSWKWDGILARELLRESWPLMIAALSVVLYMRIDQVMLRELASVKELGLYSSVILFSQAWNFIPVTLGISLLPPISKLYTLSKESFYNRIELLFALSFWLSLIISLVTVFASKRLVLVFFGPIYAEGAIVLSLHVFTNIFIFMGVVQSLWMLNTNNNKLALYRTLFGAGVSITLNYILIPHFGAVGAAMSAIASQAFATFLSNIVLAPKIFHMQLFAPFRLFHLLRMA